MAADRGGQDVKDVTASISNEYQLTYPFPVPPGHEMANSFLCVILDKNVANLAYARHKISALLENLSQRSDDVRLLEIETDFLMDKDDIRTKIQDAEAGRHADTSDEIPSYLRTEVALQLLGIETGDAIPAEKYPLI